MESFMETIPLSKLIGENNRKYGNDPDFEQLLNSIREYGLWEPPIVRKLPGGKYRIVAGRRRIAAVTKLGRETADCVVVEEDDPVDDGEIALIENVNRLNMHPLDEAASFARMAENGASIEEIAKYYARSPSAIYKRIRLNGLAEELKTMFRDGLVNITAAALLSGLPEKDQKKFAEKHSDTRNEISVWTAEEFVHKAQHCLLSGVLGDECGECSRRTHNEDSYLFEEYGNLKDVCLDSGCYTKKWHDLIAGAVGEAIAGTSSKTDRKVFFGPGIPDFLYKKANMVEFSGERYTVLTAKDYEFTNEETKRKTGACWKIDICWKTDRSDQIIGVYRVGYEKRNRNGAAENDLMKEYGAETLGDAARETGEEPKALAGKISKKYEHFWDFERAVNQKMLDRITALRLAEKTPRDYAEMYFIDKYSEEDGDTGEVIQRFINEETAGLFKRITGQDWITGIKLTPDTEKLFHFLMLANLDQHNVTTPEDIKRGNYRCCQFWRYAGLDEEAYRKEYAAVVREVIGEIDADMAAVKAADTDEAADDPGEEDEDFEEEA
jgi:ParB/RepB/Spo0J family partition protein